MFVLDYTFRNHALLTDGKDAEREASLVELLTESQGRMAFKDCLTAWRTKGGTPDGFTRTFRRMERSGRIFMTRDFMIVLPETYLGEEPTSSSLHENLLSDSR